MALYRTSSRPSHVAEAAARAARPCVMRTALGAPVEPEVKMRTNRSPGSTARPKPAHEAPAGTGSSIHPGPTTSTGAPGSSPSSNPASPGPVTTRPQSVCRTSRASSAPRRVLLRPTTVAPASAAPNKVTRYSGVLSSSTPTWNGAFRRRSASHPATRSLRATTSHHVHRRSSDTSPTPSSPARPAASWAAVVGAGLEGPVGPVTGAPPAGSPGCVSASTACRRRRRPAVAGEAPQDLLEHDPRLQPGEAGVQAQVLAEPERHVRRAHRPVDVEPVGRGPECRLVPVPRVVEQDEVRTLRGSSGRRVRPFAPVGRS